MRPCDNPFSAQRVERIGYRPASALPALTARLEQLDYRAAIIGPDGSGKTTLLADIGKQVVMQGFAVECVFVNDTAPLTSVRQRELLDVITRDTIVLLDGADHLPAFVWHRLKKDVLKSARGLVITSHKSDLLPTLVTCSTSVELCTQIVSELLAGARLGDAELLAEIYRRNAGNIRNALRELYDVWATGVGG